MGTKVKELDNRKEGNRFQCNMCNPRKDTIPHWQVWAFSLAHPGVNPFRETKR